jgi:hypothetical protein
MVFVFSNFSDFAELQILQFFFPLLQVFNLLKLLSPTIKHHVLCHFECSSIIFRMRKRPQHVMTFKLAEMETSEVQIHYLPGRNLFSFSIYLSKYKWSETTAISSFVLKFFNRLVDDCQSTQIQGQTMHHIV